MSRFFAEESVIFGWILALVMDATGAVADFSARS